MVKKLRLGCGTDTDPEWVNLDHLKMPGVDVVHDLENYPWPFFDEEFDAVLAKDVLEHLTNLVKAMKEIHRITKPGAKIIITMPHYSSYSVWLDPTHYRPVSYDTLTYFCKDKKSNFYELEGVHYDSYSFKFSSIERKILFSKGFHFWNYLVEPLANKFPYVWEHTFLKSLFPAENMLVVLIK